MYLAELQLKGRNNWFEAVAFLLGGTNIREIQLRFRQSCTTVNNTQKDTPKHSAKKSAKAKVDNFDVDSAINAVFQEYGEWYEGAIALSDLHNNVDYL